MSQIERLTAAGEVRRDEILRAAQWALRWRRRRRTASKVALIAGCVAVATASISGVWRASNAHSGREIARSGEGSERVSSPGTTPTKHAFLLVRTDPEIVERVLVHTHPIRPDQLVDDDQLEALLREAGRPEGIVRVRGRAVLASEVRTLARGGGAAAPG
jgi:hypothetical protein